MSIVLLGSTSGSCTLQEQAVAGTTTLTLPTFNGTVGLLVSGTAVASTSGTSIDFTSIPAGVRRITVMLSGVSLSASANPLIQLGTSGGIQATSYVGTLWNANTTNTALSTGFLLLSAAGAGVTIEAVVTICLLNSATGLWVAAGNIGRSDAGTAALLAGSKTLSGTLDRIRITSTSTDTFDAGTINILYE
jgi:hypothetical protein